MNTEKHFPLSEGLAIQARHLAQWQKVLSKSAMEKVQAKALDENSCLREAWGNDGHDVWRGQSITEWIQNELMNK